VAAKRYRLRERNFEMALYAGRWGHKYHDAVATCVAAVGGIIGHVLLEDSLDVRHPFLYRPLVEHGLRLQPELCVRPYARKWVLRQAMRDVLPEDVRARIGKGTPNERHAWALTNQRALLEPLVQNPMLADLGVVDGVALRRAFDSAPCRPGSKSDLHGALQGVLSIEAWLQMRAGRWPRGGAVSAICPEGTQ
jgi:asparagine synthase (glutamine-hydrolysing)